MNLRLEKIEAQLAEYLYGEREYNGGTVRVLEAERKRLADPTLEDTVVIMDHLEGITEEWRVLVRVNGLWYMHPHPSCDRENAEMIAKKFRERGTVALELWKPMITYHLSHDIKEAA